MDKNNNKKLYEHVINNCAICNCDLKSRTPKGEIIYCRDSNQNHKIESHCNCWFCTCCIEWMHHERVSRCRRCYGNIKELVSVSPYEY